MCIESAKTVNEMNLKELVKLTTLWTSGPWKLHLKIAAGLKVNTCTCFQSQCKLLYNLQIHENESAASTALFPVTALTSSKCHNSVKNDIKGRDISLSLNKADMNIWLRWLFSMFKGPYLKKQVNQTYSSLILQSPHGASHSCKVYKYITETVIFNVQRPITQQELSHDSTACLFVPCVPMFSH